MVTTDKSLSKTMLIDKIGEYTIKIVALEEELPQLARQHCIVADRADADILEGALLEELIKKRSELLTAKSHIKALRMQLRGRLEIERESIQRSLRDTYTSAASLEDLTNYEVRLGEEIAKLTKLIEDNGND